jgi:hypothetical protein
MKKALQVLLDVQQPSIVELTVTDTVLIDQLRPSAGGYIAASRSELLIPGSTTLTLERGRYVFETRAHAHLRVIHGEVDAVAAASDPVRESPPTSRGHRGPPRATAASGDDSPTFTVEPRLRDGGKTTAAPQ